jgi:hypothetical protein
MFLYVHNCVLNYVNCFFFDLCLFDELAFLFYFRHIVLEDGIIWDFASIEMSDIIVDLTV